MKKSIGAQVQIIEYTPGVEKWNSITHGVGAVLSLIGTAALVIKAQNGTRFFSALIYGLTLITVYTASTVYHSLKKGDGKRIARIADHSAVPLLIAGTATPCTLITLYEISHTRGLTVFFIGWAVALFGIISKVFFFEKLKALTMAVYIVGGTGMLLSAVPVLDSIDKDGFYVLVFGGILYVIGAVLCGLGAKKQSLHVIFHLFVLAASAVHYYGIYHYVF